MTSFKNLKLFNQFNQIEEEGNKENSITKENNKSENEEKILKENKEVNNYKKEIKKDNKKDIFITTRVDKDTKAKFKIACINKGIKESEALSFLINKFINS